MCHLDTRWLDGTAKIRAFSRVVLERVIEFDIVKVGLATNYQGMLRRAGNIDDNTFAQQRHVVNLHTLDHA
jgi:hypothetical protein